MIHKRKVKPDATAGLLLQGQLTAQDEVCCRVPSCLAGAPGLPKDEKPMCRPELSQNSRSRM